MQFGYSDNKIRIRPSFSGQKARCPLCNGTLIGKCGETYAWHWQHHQDRDCDPWQEHETEWHRTWKSKFPEDMQEVVIENYGTKHRADIKTYTGTIIEFQHSSISKATIRTREGFYGDMIWVVDAAPFAANMKKWSVVKSRLRQIEIDATDQLAAIRQELTGSFQTIQERIEKTENESVSIFHRINHHKSLLGKLGEDISNIDQLSEELTSKWEKGEMFWKSHTAAITNRLDGEYRKAFMELPQKLLRLHNERQVIEKKMADINQLESFAIDNSLFKIVTYEQLTPQNFQRVKTISKASRKTLFVEINSIKTETEFHSYRYKKDQFDFAIDPSETLNTFQDKVEEIKDSCSLIEEERLFLKREIKNGFLKYLRNQTEEIEAEIKKLSEEGDLLTKKKSTLILSQERMKNALVAEIEEAKREIESKTQEKRYKVMRDKKGTYTFDWKHERKSWQEAEAPVFFDFGDGYLYEKKGAAHFERITVEEFIGRHYKVNRLDKAQ